MKPVGKPSSRILLLVDCPVIHKADGNRATGDRSRHAPTEMQRGTTLQRCINGIAVDVANRGRRVVARVGHARRGDDGAVALKGEADGVFHTVARLVLRRRHPASSVARQTCHGSSSGDARPHRRLRRVPVAKRSRRSRLLSGVNPVRSVASNKENTVHDEIRCRPSDKDGAVRGPLVQLRRGPARPAPDVLAAARANCLDWDWVQVVRQSEGATALLRRLPTTRERLSRSSRSVLRSRHSPLHRLFKPRRGHYNGKWPRTPGVPRAVARPPPRPSATDRVDYKRRKLISKNRRAPSSRSRKYCFCSVPS